MTRLTLNQLNQLTSKKTGLMSDKQTTTKSNLDQFNSLLSDSVTKTLRRHRYRLLTTTVAEPPVSAAVESDYVVILAALLCAVICVVGLIAVARCSWLRRGSVSGSRNIPNEQKANKGMKKKMIEVIPKYTYGGDVKENDDKGCSECVICLGEYVKGDEVRVLPQCGHQFHVGCIDTWLSCHSSCPSCRRVLVARRCKKCGELPTGFGRNEVDQLEVEDKCRQHNGSSRDYLP